MSRRHSLLRATCLGAALLLWVPLAWSQPADHLVKAASIYKVAQFTTWAEVLPEGASMTLCVFGKDEVGASLEAFNGSLVAGHPLSVQAARDASSSCMIAYLADSERNRWPQLLAALHKRGVLTALDAGSTLEDTGSVLVLATVKDRVVFGINMDRARSAGLSLSAKVLRVASKVFAL